MIPSNTYIVTRGTIDKDGNLEYTNTTVGAERYEINSYNGTLVFYVGDKVSKRFYGWKRYGISVAKVEEADTPKDLLFELSDLVYF